MARAITGSETHNVGQTSRRNQGRKEDSAREGEEKILKRQAQERK